MRYVFLSIFYCLWTFVLNANTIVVTSSQKNAIKNAIQIAEDFDTIIISKGSYKEGNIKIEKPLTIIGKDMPTLDGELKYEVLSVYSNNVSISGLKIINTGTNDIEEPCGIKVYNQRNVTIANCEFKENYFAIYLQNSAECEVRNNIIIANGKSEQSIGNGVHCWKSSYIKIIGNHISGQRDGIYLEFVDHSIIWRNVATKNVRYGLHFMFSNDDAYITNLFQNNGSGVAVMYSKRVTMINNSFHINWGSGSYGLLLKEISDGLVHGNHFTKNTIAVLMEGTNRLSFEKNNFTNNGWALKLMASSLDNKLYYNTFIGNTFDASTNGTLTMNEFKHNYWDKYEGFDINKDGIGDVPFHPLSMFAMLTDQTPAAMILYRSFMVSLLDRSEKVMPSLTPENFKDDEPLMKPTIL